MTLELFAVCFAASQPTGLARFWSGLLGWELVDDDMLVPTDDTGFRLHFVVTEEPKVEPLRGHFDLTSGSLESQQRTVARALELGGRHCDVGQLPEEPHVVLADIEGNEFCVIEPENKFLADCGFVGALACDGTQQVGYFWSAALGWPLVWDREGETAIRSPHGGPKITWGGSPLAIRNHGDRLRFDLAPSADSDQATEVERLLALGASLTGDRTECQPVTLADPDGSRFCVLADH